MLAKLNKPYSVGYVQIMQGATVVIIEHGEINSRVCYMDYTFTVSNEDLDIIE